MVEKVSLLLVHTSTQQPLSLMISIHIHFANRACTWPCIMVHTIKRSYVYYMYNVGLEKVGHTRVLQSLPGLRL